MADDSYLDSKYFIDETIHNCPFCRRRHVSYLIAEFLSFDWTDSKKAYLFTASCRSCFKSSLHLSFSNLAVKHVATIGRDDFYQFSGALGHTRNNDVDFNKLDHYFFFSVPSSKFVLDSRIPAALRELMTEAEGCLKSNFLTGASACVRKVVYELGVLHGASGDSYEEKIKSLKDVLPSVDPTYFDTLLTIQQVTSTKVHENAYDGWKSEHLQSILTTLQEALNEIYVIPKMREENRQKILSIKAELTATKPSSPTKNAG